MQHKAPGIANCSCCTSAAADARRRPCALRVQVYRIAGNTNCSSAMQQISSLRPGHDSRPPSPLVGQSMTCTSNILSQKYVRHSCSDEIRNTCSSSLRSPSVDAHTLRAHTAALASDTLACVRWYQQCALMACDLCACRTPQMRQLLPQPAGPHARLHSMRGLLFGDTFNTERSGTGTAAAKLYVQTDTQEKQLQRTTHRYKNTLATPPGILHDMLWPRA